MHPMTTPSLRVQLVVTEAAAATAQGETKQGQGQQRTVARWRGEHFTTQSEAAFTIGVHCSSQK